MRFHLARIATLIRRPVKGLIYLAFLTALRNCLCGGLSLNSRYPRNGIPTTDAFASTAGCWRHIPRRDTAAACTHRAAHAAHTDPRLKRCERAKLALACRGP